MGGRVTAVLHNPFANDLFLPVVARVALLLALGLVAVVAAERKPYRVLRRSTLFLRLRTWLWIAPLFLLAMFIGGAAAFTLAIFVALQAISEYIRLVGITRRYGLLLMLWTLAGMVITAFAPAIWAAFLPFGFFMILTLIPIVSGRGEDVPAQDALRDVAATLFGYIYIGLPMAFIVFVKTHEAWGLEFLVIVAIAVAVSDVAGFVGGAAVRTPKLLNRISGNKTWSALAGNILGAAAGVALMWVAIPDAWTGAGVAALALTIGIGCIWGDLTSAVLKRDFAVRGTGSLLFGFGGILERVDSLLLSVPLGYYVLLLANQLAS
jgi:phosphatidate cytidylyltransferase